MIDSPAPIAPGSLKAWGLAIRPATLSAGAVPVAIGTAVAYHCGGAEWYAASAALGVALGLQIAANFANDVFDFEKGADTIDRLGPTRTAQAGLLTPKQLRIGLGIVITLAFASGSYLAIISSPWLWAIGILAIFSAVAYTGGPFPLGYNGLGDIFVLIFFGFVAVCGSVYVQIGDVPVLAWVAAIPAGAMATGILVVNNIRDRHTDARAGKRTVAVRFGRSFAFGEYVVLMVAAFAIPCGLAASGRLGFAVLLPLLTLPFAVYLIGRVLRDEGRALNASLAGTARLMALFGALFAAGIALG